MSCISTNTNLNTMSEKAKTCLWVCFFSVAMAALESAVVVYLRTLYYPEGFSVAFKLIDENILQVELLRELATIIMLIAIGYLAGRSFSERFAYFLLSFAVWDIFYYVWLKVLLGWPASLLEWDILFLIPITWLGPVLAPLICSVTMILLAFVLLKGQRPVSSAVWPPLLIGSLLILFTFTEDYGALIISNSLLPEYPDLITNQKFLQAASVLIPEDFNWLVFSIGEVFLLMAVYTQLRGIQHISRFIQYPFRPTART